MGEDVGAERELFGGGVGFGCLGWEQGERNNYLRKGHGICSVKGLQKASSLSSPPLPECSRGELHLVPHWAPEFLRFLHSASADSAKASNQSYLQSSDSHLQSSSCEP